MALFKLPRFVALDTSHLGAWARDWWSADHERSARAKAVRQELDAAGWIPLISFHHLTELFAHGEDSVVEERIEFLCQLDVLGWVALREGEPCPATIVDVLAAELEAVLSRPGATSREVRDMTRPKVLRVGRGEEAVQGFRFEWRKLRPFFQAQAEDVRRNVAITRSGAFDANQLRVAELLKGHFKTPVEQRNSLETMHSRLSEQIRMRGDRRIADADQVATDFFLSVAQAAKELPSDPREFVLALLEAKNVEPGDVGPDTTIGDLDEIGIFRGHLKVAAEVLGRPWADIKCRVHPNQFPTWIIDRGLRLFGQDNPERKGSDLNDSYLTALAAYAGLTLVDKRTLQNVRQAQAKSPAFADIIGPVVKVSQYADVISVLPD